MNTLTESDAKICITRCDKCGLEHSGEPYGAECKRCWNPAFPAGHTQRWITPPAAEPQWRTIVIVEDHIPDHGHYYHGMTLTAAIDAAQKKGCHAAKAWCYDSERHTHNAREAKQMKAIWKGPR